MIIQDNKKIKRRDWVFTLNNYTDEEYLNIIGLDAKYIIVGKEIGAINNVLHLQGYIYFKYPKTFKQVKNLLSFRAHIEPRKGTIEQAINYCKKDGNFVEIGVKPLSNLEKGDIERDRWNNMYELAKRGQFDEIPKREFILHKKKFEDIFKKEKEKEIKILDRITCLWIVGKPRTGKTFWANKKFPNAYLKMDNPKWWDSYAGEEEVIIDEVTPDRWKKDADTMKKIADIYPIRVEIKGDSILIRPKTIIITSNFKIEEVWDNLKDIKALNRRFKTIEFNKKFEKETLRHNIDIEEILSDIPIDLDKTQEVIYMNNNKKRKIIDLDKEIHQNNIIFIEEDRVKFRKK